MLYCHQLFTASVRVRSLVKNVTLVREKITPTQAKLIPLPINIVHKIINWCINEHFLVYSGNYRLMKANISFHCKLSTWIYCQMSKRTIYTQYRTGVIEIYVPKDNASLCWYTTRQIKLCKTVKRLRFLQTVWSALKNGHYDKIRIRTK